MLDSRFAPPRESVIRAALVIAASGLAAVVPVVAASSEPGATPAPAESSSAEASTASAQLPDEFTNLQVLPADISRDDLVGIMRGFSFSLGVRCQHCHVGGDGISFEGVEFPTDSPQKEMARFMLRMTERLNAEILPAAPARGEQPVRIECKTCHRGQPRPLLLKQELMLTLDTDGLDAAAARYRTLREELGMSGAFDFGEWETNTLAESLAAAGRLRDAIGIYELNLEYYPESVAILLALGGLYEREGDNDTAIRYYERVLELRPGQPVAEERLEALRR